MMTEIEFQALAAQGYNRIPLIVETYADLDTPLGIYLKLAHAGPENGRNSCLLESVVGGERFGRYSFVGLPAKTLIRNTGDVTEVVHYGRVVETHQGDPLQFIADYQKRFKVALLPGMPRFSGGLAGYFGYDTVRHIEPRLGPAVKPFPRGQESGTPDILLLHIDELVIIDNLAGRTYLMVYADPALPEDYARAKRRLKELREKLRMPIAIPYAYASLQTEARRDFAKPDYLDAVARAKDLIMGGDLMQVQVGQVIAKPFRDAPLSLYRALRSLNPSPYMYYWNLDDFHVVGASPEILVRQEPVLHAGQMEKQVTVRPLAGTRKRGGSVEEDLALEAELLADPKERAEHVMLIDLARNDIRSHRHHDGRALFPRHASGLECHRHLAAGAGQYGRTARHLPRWHLDRCAQGARHGNHRPTRTRAPWHLRRCHGLSQLRRRNGPGHCHPHGFDQRRHALRPSRRWHRGRFQPRSRMARNRIQSPCGTARCRTSAVWVG